MPPHSERTTLVVKDAGKWARSRGLEGIGTEILVLGIFMEGGYGAQRLVEAGIDKPRITRHIQDNIRLRDSPTMRPATLMTDAFLVMSAGNRLAERKGHPNVLPEHLLLAILDKAEGGDTKIIRLLRPYLEATRHRLEAYTEQVAVTPVVAKSPNGSSRSNTAILDFVLERTRKFPGFFRGKPRN